MKPGFMMGLETKKSTVVKFPVGSPTGGPKRRPKSKGNGRRQPKYRKQSDLQSISKRNAAVSAFILAQRTWESEWREHGITHECIAAGTVIERAPLVGWIEVNCLYERYREWLDLEGKAAGHELMSARKFRNGCEAVKMDSRRVWCAEERRHHTERYIKQPHVSMHSTCLEPVKEVA